LREKNEQKLEIMDKKKKKKITFELAAGIYEKYYYSISTCYKYSSSVAAFCRSPEVKDNLDKMTTFTVNSDE